MFVRCVHKYHLSGGELTMNLASVPVCLIEHRWFAFRTVGVEPLAVGLELPPQAIDEGILNHR